MGVIQDTDTVAYLFLHQLPHTLSKRTRIADGGSLTDTGGKGDGVSALFYQRTGPQHRLFPRAAATVDKALPAGCRPRLQKRPFVPGWYENPGFLGSNPLSAYNG